MGQSGVKMIFILCLSFAIGAALLFTPTVHGQPNFFQGKSLRVIRGGQPGDLYDLWTRHIATYLGKHIPGNPQRHGAKHVSKPDGDRQ